MCNPPTSLFPIYCLMWDTTQDWLLDRSTPLCYLIIFCVCICCFLFYFDTLSCLFPHPVKFSICVIVCSTIMFFTNVNIDFYTVCLMLCVLPLLHLDICLKGCCKVVAPLKWYRGTLTLSHQYCAQAHWLVSMLHTLLKHSTLPWLWHGWKRCASARWGCSCMSTSSARQCGHDNITEYFPCLLNLQMWACHI